MMTIAEKKKSAARAIKMTPARALWIGDDGILRRGHSSDMIQMLEDLGIQTAGY